ncbi:hypothetical protein QW131_02565 [Roseibium salinum]|nr:hypothetical protein [Roseibium salinum]
MTGALALALAVIAFLLKRFDLISADVFVLSLIAAAAIALLSAAMAATAFHRIWTYGGPGIPSALAGLVFSGLSLVPPALVLAMLVLRPEAEDLSTDLGNPPELKRQAVAGEQPFLNWLQDAAADRVWPFIAGLSDRSLSAGAGQEQLYPDIVSRRYRIPPPNCMPPQRKPLKSWDGLLSASCRLICSMIPRGSRPKAPRRSSD